MSQWNNSYSYNSQYQGANAWNADVNSQFANTGFYPNTANQYVSFNEFLSQMQGSSSQPATNVTSYNNLQIQNYPVNQHYNYQDIPSSTQNIQAETFNYETSSSAIPNKNTYRTENQPNFLIPDQNNITSELVMKSNLTPTATEFVPKSITVTPAPDVHLQSSSTYNNKDSNRKETRTSYGTSSSSKNWRDRPQSSQQNGSVVQEIPSQNEANRSESNNYKTFDPNNFNRESNKNRKKDYNNRRNDNRNQGNNVNSNEYSYEPSSSNNESTTRNGESSRRNYDTNSRNGDSSGQQYEANNYEPNGRNEASNRYNENRGQSKSKSKNKDSERTFYNSGISKGQDARSGRGDGTSRKSWVGSQRLRTAERNSTEDEHYANSYLQCKEEKEKNYKENIASPRKNKNTSDQKGQKEMTQRERLSEQLDKGTLECLVCCERVKQTDPVWSCTNCYHVLHLRCIRKWALSSVVESKWRCPACQNLSSEVPLEYRCLCGAARAAEWSRGATGAHTCGRACQRKRECQHACPLPCHPGPCPPCQAIVTRACGCGAESHSVSCSNKSQQVCGRVCGRQLECGAHSCARDCHHGPCDPCELTVTQVCYCEASRTRVVPCTPETRWQCGEPCDRVLHCGAHTCSQSCHRPPCPPCALRPDNVRTCPCGKTQLDKERRKKCTDPIPLCGNICAKPLSCGPAGDKHFCKMDCHEGECPQCPEKTLLQCRCGHSSREVPCVDLPQMINNVFCQKKCNKKLSCGRHRCRAACCAASSHRCTVVCGRTLSCQLHRCAEFCHTGHCAPCPRLSFEELRCSCGLEVVYPPVRCGTKRPACSAECTRPRPCGHPPHHACHTGPCPPCVVLTTRACYGNHETRKTIPCSQEEFSCGLPCGKPLSCGKHTCIKICHKGPCDTAKCVQPCREKRPTCGHECNAPCHAEAPAGSPAAVCPSTAPCRRVVRACCPCTRRHQDRTCADNARDRAKILSALAASKMQEGESVDLSDVQRQSSMLKTLECDEECRVEARTRQMALALQIRNPDVSSKLAPRYSDSLRAAAAKDPAFAQQVHDALTELVHKAKKSKQKTRSHSFPSMNWQKRQFIHELCEHFGCESVAYDAEPNRNVVATADKEKSWLPAMSILEVISREAGRRRVPGPVVRAPPPSTSTASSTNGGSNNTPRSTSGWATLTSTNAWAARSQRASQNQSAGSTATAAATSSSSANTTAQAPAAKIDYFDNPPEN